MPSDNLIDLLKSREQFLTVSELAALLHVCPDTVYRYASRGSIPHSRVCGQIRFDPLEIAEWLEQRSYSHRKKSRHSLANF